MNNTFKLLLANLAAEKIELEEELERLFNSNYKTTKKIKLIKKTLSNISLNEMNVSKLSGYIKQPDSKELLTDNSKNKKK